MVTRYDFYSEDADGGEHAALTNPSVEGDYVKYTDYAKLEAEHEAMATAMALLDAIHSIRELRESLEQPVASIRPQRL